MQEKITQGEWVLIVLVLGLAGMLGAISYADSNLVKNRRQARDVLKPHPKRVIEISIQGAVENPGIFYFQPGCSLKEVLKIACLCKDADRKKVSLEKIIYKSMSITVPRKSTSKKTREKKNLR